MSTSIVTWSQDMSSLGSAAVAVGVFDGVHMGHQALLRDTVADAQARGIRSMAVTFDRDPDQIVSPESAAPQLLTLADKLDFIAETGIDVILVVPFTPVLADMAPESFVDSVLLAAMRPLTVHVGRDFRFGNRATGDIATLQRLGLSHGFEVWPHDLVEVDGSPVTSTRIRALVAAGDMAAASVLLGRAPRVAGTVHRGRGEGVKLGFPTANIVPLPFAALPADGVYAGRAILEDNVEWAAAISVGAPPTFPEAKDYLEAHLIDFEGDLYDQSITIEFFTRLRDQIAYESLEELQDAIAADVGASLEIAGFEDDDEDDGATDAVSEPGGLASAVDRFFGREPLADEGEGAEGGSEEYDHSSFEDPVFDHAALEAAEEAARGVKRSPRRERDDELVVLAQDLPYDKPRLLAISAALEAAGVDAIWDPYPPENAPLLRLAILGDNRFRITVWNSQLELARAALQDTDSGE